ncbi:MAG: PKD domain-containing protein [Flavobacteriales bacterium]|nr:PKD domain-containing protein [Flavobacteriales bacterium]
MSEGGPAMICIGETLQFDGTGSFTPPASGFNIVSYSWNFADGNTANSMSASHSWDTGRVHRATLRGG